MNRKYSRVAALALFLYLSVSPVVTAATVRDRDVADPGERVVRVVKKIKDFFRGLTTLDEWNPPVPKP